MKEGIVSGVARELLPTSGLPGPFVSPLTATALGKSWASCLCACPHPVTGTSPPGSGFWAFHTAVAPMVEKEALFFNPQWDRPLIYSCYLLSNCSRLNLNSFTVSVRFCFLKISHWEYLTLGRERDQRLMKLVNRVSHGRVTDVEGVTKSQEKTHCLTHCVSSRCVSSRCGPQPRLIGGSLFLLWT